MFDKAKFYCIKLLDILLILVFISQSQRKTMILYKRNYFSKIMSCIILKQFYYYLKSILLFKGILIKKHTFYSPQSLENTFCYCIHIALRSMIKCILQLYFTLYTFYIHFLEMILVIYTICSFYTKVKFSQYDFI